MKSTAVDKGPGALDLIEEASHLLWTAPVRVWALYYMGAAPFVMALLYFLVVMRLDPPGDDRGDTLALGVALLYLWMRCWQAHPEIQPAGRMNRCACPAARCGV